MITGTHISYYFHCPRHLWLFAHNINMEHNSENVDIGRFISNSTYERQQHEIRIHNDEFDIVLDFYDAKNKVIHEVKKSSKMEETHIWQVKFYIFVLNQIGINDVSGDIDYPLLRQKIKVSFSEEDSKKIQTYITEIKEIISSDLPPKPINKPFCKNCSYYELCYI